MNYLYKKTKRNFESFYNHKYISDAPLRIETVEFGTVIPHYLEYDNPSGVYNKNGDYVDISTDRYSISAHLDLSQIESINTIDKQIIYLGSMGTSHYGCFLIDYLSRFWYKIQHISDSHIFVYIGKPDVFKTKWSLYFLSLFHISPSQIINIHTPTRFQSVIVPQITFAHDVLVHILYPSIFEYLTNKMNLESTGGGGGKLQIINKIYLTRTQLKYKKEIGEEIFEQFFRINGFSIIALETLPYAEQAFLIKNCKVIASIEGTHAHSIVFKAISGIPYTQILLRKQSECIPRQIQLNQITKGEAVWIDVWKEPFRNFPISHDRGPFLIEWNTLIQKFAEDNGMITPKINVFVVYKNRVLYCIKCICYLVKHTIKQFYVNKLDSRKLRTSC